MAPVPDPDIWRPAEELASEWAIPTSEVVSLILDGDVEGKRFEYRWYVPRPTVNLYYPDPDDRRHAELHFRCCRLGNYLTAGRGEMIVPIRHGDPGLEEALALAWEIDASKPPKAAGMRLGCKEWIVDSTLSLDLGRRLLEFDVDCQLDELLDGYESCG